MSGDKALCDQSAVWLHRAIKRRDIAARDLVESCIQRIEDRNPQLNAVVTPCFDAALKQVAAQDAIKDTSDLPLLHGLPVLIKDLTETKGLRTTFGSRVFNDHVPVEDDPIVTRLRDAGAIVLGKTNTPEFGAGGNTNNDVFGATRNPIDANLTSGGSSGGSAAALAAGMSPLATGSDFGGSLRIPSAFCGVVGFRASMGWVPAPRRKLGYSPLWVEGPMARSAADVALLFDVMRGYSLNDPLSSPIAQSAVCIPAPPLKNVRIGFSADLGTTPLDTGVAEAFQIAKERLSGLFGQAFDYTVNLSDGVEIFRILRAEDMLACHTEVAATAPELLGDNVRAGLEEAHQVTLQERARAGVQHSQFARAFQAIFDDIDVLVCPACAIPPFPVEQNYPEHINGESLRTYYSWYALTFVLSLTGSPVISIPFGNDKKGMPFGLQIVMPRNQDLALLALASKLEGTIGLSSNN